MIKWQLEELQSKSGNKSSSTLKYAETPNDWSVELLEPSQEESPQVLVHPRISKILRVTETELEKPLDSSLISEMLTRLQALEEGQ